MSDLPRSLGALFQPDFPLEWELFTLYQLADWINGLAFRDIDFADTGHPVIKIAEVKNGISNQTRYTAKQYDSKYLVLHGDMLFCWSGQPNTSIGTFWWHGSKGWLNQHIFKVIPNSDVVDRKFLFQLLRYIRPNFVEIARNKQTTGLGHVTRRDLETISVRVPGLPEQRGIAATLGALDDKIESNRRAIDLANEMMTALFERSEMRRRVVASNVMTPVLGGTPKRDVSEYWSGNIPWASAKDIAASSAGFVTSVSEHVSELGVAMSNTKVLPTGTIVITARGTVGALARLAMPMAFNQSCYALVARSDVSVEVLYLSLKEAIQRIRDAGHGTVFNTINMATFDKIELDLPADLSTTLLGQLAGLSDFVLHRLLEISSLERLRDSLLPELLSGRIRVPEAQEVVEDVV